MTHHPTTIPTPLAERTVAAPTFLHAIVLTTKPGITRLVTITALVGFAMGALGRSWTASDLSLALIGCAIGTFLSAAGANALNQWLERDRDAIMPRTARRPIPAGHLTASTVLSAGLLLCVVGLVVLITTVGMVPALVSLMCMLVYVLAYTPLKTRTTLATLVGTIPGALPPLIGWTSATSDGGFGSLWMAGGLSLFVLMTVWQLPHFWAIAWMFRDDYAHGGYRMLPLHDATGVRTATAIVATSVLLIPATLWPAFAMPDMLGLAYISVAGITGVAFLALAVAMARSRSRQSARRLFFASIIHLPLLLVAMVGDAMLHAFL